MTAVIATKSLVGFGIILIIMGYSFGFDKRKKLFELKSVFKI